MKTRYILFACSIIFFLIIFIHRFYRSDAASFVSNIPLTNISIKDTFQDVGIQKYRVPVKADFVVYNKGIQNLYIQSVKPDCHCTLADFPTKPIRPRDSAVIVLKYDASNLGPFQSSATVTTNTTTSPRLLFFRGFVKEKTD